MKLIVGIDIGNATTESTLAEVDGEDIKVLGSSIEKTTGIKGTKENIKGVYQSLYKLFEKTGKNLDELSLIRINEAAPVIGDVAMETITETIITESTMIGHNPSTPGGIGVGVGVSVLLNEIDDIAKICWNENNKYLGDADDKYTVINPTKILETALSYSGYKNAKIIYSVRSSSISGNSDYSIRFIKAKNHFQLDNMLCQPVCNDEDLTTSR